MCLAFFLLLSDPAVKQQYAVAYPCLVTLSFLEIVNFLCVIVHQGQVYLVLDTTETPYQTNVQVLDYRVGDDTPALMTAFRYLDIASGVFVILEFVIFCNHPSDAYSQVKVQTAFTRKSLWEQWYAIAETGTGSHAASLIAASGYVYCPLVVCNPCTQVVCTPVAGILDRSSAEYVASHLVPPVVQSSTQ